MASAALSRRVGKVVGYPPLSDMGTHQRREFQEALLDADTFEDLPGKWQAGILKAEQKPPEAACRHQRLVAAGRTPALERPAAGVADSVQPGLVKRGRRGPDSSTLDGPDRPQRLC